MIGGKVKVLNKKFLSIEEKIRKVQSRGMEITIEDKEFIEKYNYYNIFNGYKDLLIEKNDIYKKGTSFKEIESIYQFDKYISMLFFKEVLKIESIFKTIVAEVFAMKYGYKKEYFDSKNFFIRKGKKLNKENFEQLQSEIKKIYIKKDSKGYIKHYLENYNYVPIWVLVNALSFGNTLYFYQFLRDEARVEVAKRLSYNYKLYEKDVVKLLNIVRQYRNSLAHDERFYKLTFPHSVSFKRLGVLPYDKDCNVASLFYIIKVFLTPNEFNLFLSHFKIAYHHLDCSLFTIKGVEILKAMGFKDNEILTDIF